MPHDALRGTPGSRRMARVAAGKEPVVTTPGTISDFDTPLGAARSNLTETQRHLPHAEAKYRQAKEACDAAEAELTELRERIARRETQLAERQGAAEGV